jgi:hypothetical protein
MRWKLIRRRLSVNAPRMIVRSHLPWPLRWAVVALIFGFSAAIGLWAFEWGKDIAGVDRDAKVELAALRAEMQRLREERDKAQSIANTAESLLRAGAATQEALAKQLRDAEIDNLALKGDLGFFEQLLPATGEGLAVRSLQAEVQTPGRLRYQILLMQSGKALPEFSGRYEVTLSGQREGRPWTLTMPGGARPLQVKQYARVEGLIDLPADAVVKAVQVTVKDASGVQRAMQSLKL